jgi:hypothetical protein
MHSGRQSSTAQKPRLPGCKRRVPRRLSSGARLFFHRSRRLEFLRHGRLLRGGIICQVTNRRDWRHKSEPVAPLSERLRFLVRVPEFGEALRERTRFQPDTSGKLSFQPAEHRWLPGYPTPPVPRRLHGHGSRQMALRGGYRSPRRRQMKARPSTSSMAAMRG